MLTHFGIFDVVAILILFASNILWLFKLYGEYAIGLLFVGWLTAIAACVYAIRESFVYMGLPGSWRAVDMWWDSVIPMLTIALLLTWIPLRSWFRMRKQFSFVQYKWIFIYISVACVDLLLLAAIADYAHKSY